MKEKVKIESLFSNARASGNQTYIIAEIGINHEGSVNRCAEMIRAYSEAGADAIKLQTVDAARCYAPDSESYKIFSCSMLTAAETENMFRLARECGVEPFTTSGDLQTLHWVDQLDPVAHKISSGLLSCLPIVRSTSKFGKPILMSTGMSDTDTIDEAVKIVRPSGCPVGLFQCTSEYPCPTEKLNLASINAFSNRYGLPTGFSDHSLGVNMAPIAVAAGARFIEKHVTFDNKRRGFDHSISLVKSEFAEMVSLIRQVEAALGRTEKVVDGSMLDYVEASQRRLAAGRDLIKGQALTLDDLLFIRFTKTVNAIPSSETEKVIGKQISENLSIGQAITWQNLS